MLPSGLQTQQCSWAGDSGMRPGDNSWEEGHQHPGPSSSAAAKQAS
jgi:hypothetical protein